jgi:hypothetical protein
MELLLPIGYQVQDVPDMNETWINIVQTCQFWLTQAILIILTHHTNVKGNVAYYGLPFFNILLSYSTDMIEVCYKKQGAFD